MNQHTVNTKIACLSLLFSLVAFNLSAGEKWVFAIDIIRHGDRTPTAELPGDDPAIWREGLGKMTALGMS
jgi:acid phosphatase